MGLTYTFSSDDKSPLVVEHHCCLQPGGGGFGNDARRVSVSMSNTIGVKAVKFRVVVHSAEEGGLWAEIPALAGCVSEGETLAETLVNIREAAEGWLAVAALSEADL